MILFARRNVILPLYQIDHSIFGIILRLINSWHFLFLEPFQVTGTYSKCTENSKSLIRLIIFYLFRGGDEIFRIGIVKNKI